MRGRDFGYSGGQSSPTRGCKSVPEAEHEPAELIVRIPDGIDFWIPSLPPLLSNSIIESQYTGRFKVLSVLDRVLWKTGLRWRFTGRKFIEKFLQD